MSKNADYDHKPFRFIGYQEVDCYDTNDTSVTYPGSEKCAKDLPRGKGKNTTLQSFGIDIHTDIFHALDGWVYVFRCPPFKAGKKKWYWEKEIQCFSDGEFQEVDISRVNKQLPYSREPTGPKSPLISIPVDQGNLKNVLVAFFSWKQIPKENLPSMKKVKKMWEVIEQNGFEDWLWKNQGEKYSVVPPSPVNYDPTINTEHTKDIVIVNNEAGCPVDYYYRWCLWDPMMKAKDYNKRYLSALDDYLEWVNNERVNKKHSIYQIVKNIVDAHPDSSELLIDSNQPGNRLTLANWKAYFENESKEKLDLLTVYSKYLTYYLDFRTFLSSLRTYEFWVQSQGLTDAEIENLEDYQTFKQDYLNLLENLNQSYNGKEYLKSLYQNYLDEQTNPGSKSPTFDLVWSRFKDSHSLGLNFLKIISGVIMIHDNNRSFENVIYQLPDSSSMSMKRHNGARIIRDFLREITGAELQNNNIYRFIPRQELPFLVSTNALNSYEHLDGAAMMDIRNLCNLDSENYEVMSYKSNVGTLSANKIQIIADIINIVNLTTQTHSMLKSWTDEKSKTADTQNFFAWTNTSLSLATIALSAFKNTLTTAGRTVSSTIVGIGFVQGTLDVAISFLDAADPNKDITKSVTVRYASAISTMVGTLGMCLALFLPGPGLIVIALSAIFSIVLSMVGQRDSYERLLECSSFSKTYLNTDNPVRLNLDKELELMHIYAHQMYIQIQYTPVNPPSNPQNAYIVADVTIRPKRCFAFSHLYFYLVFSAPHANAHINTGLTDDNNNPIYGIVEYGDRSLMDSNRVGDPIPYDKGSNNNDNCIVSDTISGSNCERIIIRTIIPNYNSTTNLSAFLGIKLDIYGEGFSKAHPYPFHSNPPLLRLRENYGSGENSLLTYKVQDWIDNNPPS